MKAGSEQKGVSTKATQRMSVRVFALLCLLLTVFLPNGFLLAQQSKKVSRIGYLAPGTRSALAGRTEALRHGLGELGYLEGKNIIVEWRYADGKLDRLPALAAELLQLKVEVIVTGGSASTRAAQEATSTIPIVMTQDPDPIGSGFITTLARPGGNITGLSNLVSDLSGKRLELLKETVPRLSRVAIFGSSETLGNRQQLRETELASAALGIRTQYLDVLAPEDIETAFRAASNERADAALVLAASVFNTSRKRIAELAVKSRLAAIYINPEYVESGGLMSYGASINDLYRRAATYVDKILKGAKPGDLPVEQPKKFEFIINLKAAKQIGLTIPPNVLARADKVIK